MPHYDAPGHDRRRKSSTGALVAPRAITLPRITRNTEHFSIARVKHEGDRPSLLVSLKGQTEHPPTLIFPNISKRQARDLLEILTKRSNKDETINDPFPSVTRAANAMLYASAQEIEVTTPEGKAGHDQMSTFFDEQIQRFSMPEIQRMFRVEGLGDGIYHLSFSNQFLMNACFMRIQEHFESPLFRGKIFSHEAFRAWYRTTRSHNEFSYYTDWGGFNVPGYVLTSFLNGRFAPLRSEESALVETFRGMRGPLYIIGTLQTDTIDTLRHEIAHALYHTNPTYRGAVDALLDGINCTPIHHLLKALGYHRAQWRDETHAYLGDDPWQLETHGVSTTPYTKVRRDLLRIYNKHSPIRHS